ncbi:MAG TPA: hypothetical protein VGN23_00425 [Verrucomicrobiae bacterium]|jgi:hypothetical protein
MRRAFFFVLISCCLIGGNLLAAETMDLSGQWRFALDPNDLGITNTWFTSNLPDKITLPGILQAQGYGDDISTNTPWVLTLGDAWWKLQPAALHDHFSQPGHVEVPFLSQPPKHYLGAAWYQRDINIPQDWKGKHFTLFLEHPHWKSTVWVDDQEYPAQDSLVAPHITDLGILAPGKHRVTICVDNRLQLPPAGHLVDSHSISDSLGAAWNGIVGKIELQAASPVWIDDVQVFPNITNKSALVKIKIGNSTGEPGNGSIAAVFDGMDSVNMPASVPVTWDASGGSATLEIPMPNAKLWDEFHPNLQSFTLQLFPAAGGHPLMTYPVTFGLRQITAEGKDMFINGRLVNLRMTHFGGDFPLTGYPAMDVASWKKIFQACKDFGLNGMRFHSWCPPEAAFEAADEMGFYLQPECGLWADFRNPVMKQWLNDETARLLKAYGNHPSFILLSPSNEPRNYQNFTPEWAAMNYTNDNRRLYTSGTGWGDLAMFHYAQYAAVPHVGPGNLRGPSGWFGSDYRDALADVNIPVLGHEVGQWCAYPDFNVMNEFTGYLQPGNYDIFKYIAKQEGVLDEDKDFAWASGRFQLESYKEEIEANLRTPSLSGFELLDLHDYLGQGTALVGVLDAFWKPKSYVSAVEYRSFAGPIVPLARLDQRTFTTDETLTSDVEIYNFGEGPISNAQPYWKIVDTAGKSVAGGDWDARDLPIGKNIPLGKVSADLSKLAAPGAYKLVVGLKNTNIQNDWNIWLYPAQIEPSKTADVLITNNWAAAQTALAAGGKVLFMPTAADLDPTRCPPMKNVPIFWNIQMTVRPPQNPRPRFDAMLGLLCETDSPALAEFPTDKNCDWQWTPLINNVRSVNLENAPRSLKPIVWAIDDWNRNWKLGVIFECNVGPGRLLVSAINLDGDHGAPGLQQLRRSLLDYIGSDKFHPTVRLTPDQASSLWARSNSSNTQQPARVFDPDLNDGSIPAPKQ